MILKSKTATALVMLCNYSPNLENPHWQRSSGSINIPTDNCIEIDKLILKTRGNARYKNQHKVVIEMNVNLNL